MFSIDVDQCAPSMKAPEATWEPPAPRKTSEAYRPRPRKLQDRYPKAAVAEDQNVDLGHIDVQHRALSDELDTWDGHDEMLLAIDNYVRKRWLAASFVKWNDCRKKQCTAMESPRDMQWTDSPRDIQGWSCFIQQSQCLMSRAKHALEVLVGTEVERWQLQGQVQQWRSRSVNGARPKQAYPSTYVPPRPKPRAATAPRSLRHRSMYVPPRPKPANCGKGRAGLLVFAVHRSLLKKKVQQWWSQARCSKSSWPTTHVPPRPQKKLTPRSYPIPAPRSFQAPQPAQCYKWPTFYIPPRPKPWVEDAARVRMHSSSFRRRPSGDPNTAPIHNFMPPAPRALAIEHTNSFAGLSCIEETPEE